MLCNVPKAHYYVWVLVRGKVEKIKMPIKIVFARSKASKIKVRIEHPFWRAYQVY